MSFISATYRLCDIYCSRLNLENCNLAALAVGPCGVGPFQRSGGGLSASPKDRIMSLSPSSLSRLFLRCLF